MRPLLTRRSKDPDAAAPADGDATRETAAIQAPPPTGPPQRPAGTPTRVDTPQLAPPDPLAAASAGPAERGKFRRRLRRLKRVRQKQLAELGTLVVDARKRGNGSRPEVLERRAAEAAEVDRQVRELSHAVDAHADTRELATGVAGTCKTCGELLSTEDRFCPACGTPTKASRKRPADPAPDDAAATPAEAAAPSAPGPPMPAPLPPPLPGATTPPPPTVAAQPPEAAAEPPPPEEPETAFAHVDPATIPPPPPPPPK
jgi:hypothetical protein